MDLQTASLDVCGLVCFPAVGEVDRGPRSRNNQVQCQCSKQSPPYTEMKKLFDKAKLEFKFKKAGEGHTLNEENSGSSRASTSQQTPAERSVPVASAQKAGQAALERFSQQEKASARRPQSATATWRHGSDSTANSEIERMRRQVRQEIRNENAAQQRSDQTQHLPVNTEPVKVESAGTLSVQGVFFKCPFCSSSFLSHAINAHLAQCLENEHAQDPVMASAAMIHTLNQDKSQVKAGMDVICRYIDNICKHPTEEKYRRIKHSNRVFQERVTPLRGTVEFLLACGFTEELITVQDLEEKFYVFPVNKDSETLEAQKGILISAEALKITLDRCLKIYQPSSDASRFDLPQDFFTLSSDEIKREQKLRAEDVERCSQLRTRAMREAEKRPAKIYQFTLLRVRFPDGVTLQGTFYSREKLRDLFEFVRQSLESDWQPFVLSETTGQLTNEEKSFEELGLVPAALVNFAWDPAILADIVAARGSVEHLSGFLKPELLDRKQQL